MIAVNMKGKGKIELGTPHELFDTGQNIDPVNDQCAVAADGQRFLLLKPLCEATPITVVPN